ncbi:hypothetical protein [Curtobacterium sp. BH-2-1-1]|uniref:hypothetical protein n=1 Tax=Curtobacterium sp. BH-2-1-1 TaxID=1905847 RepID=UPI0012EA8BFF|nr:hypothetical protein [Curtobacterium sp. BH-2-1-1]
MNMDLGTWLLSTTTASVGLATWVTAAVTGVGGFAALVTYRRSVNDAASAQAASTHVWVDDRYVRCVSEDYGFSPLRASPEDLEIGGWTTGSVDGSPYARTAAPVFHLRNDSGGPVRIDNIRLRWTAAIDLDPRDDEYQHTWFLVPGAGTSRGLRRRTTRRHLHTESLTPTFAAGVRVVWPGMEGREELPWTTDDEPVVRDLGDALGFVLSMFLHDPPSGFTREQLVGIAVDVLWVDLTDARGRRWRRRGTGISRRRLIRTRRWAHAGVQAMVRSGKRLRRRWVGHIGWHHADVPMHGGSEAGGATITAGGDGTNLPLAANPQPSATEPT